MKSKTMNPKALAVALLLFVGIGVSLADDPVMAPAPSATPSAQSAPPATAPPAPPASDAPQIPRTHVDSTVVGDSAGDANQSQDPHNAAINLDNDHGFQAGAPDLVQATAPLNLSAQQKAKIHDAIEKWDAGAAVLIKRENVVRQMLAATTPEDPLYAKLTAEQASADSRWIDNRSGLRRAVSEVLTPAQRAKFEQSQPTP